MTATPLRWGILGTGWVAHMFCHDLVANGITIAAVGARNLDTAWGFAAEYRVPAAHGSYAELACDPNVDIVYVSSPHPFHAPHAELAIRAGKHVMVEKPFTINAVEAQRLVDLAAEHDVTVLEAMWTRYVPHIARIDEIIAAGRIRPSPTGCPSALIPPSRDRLLRHRFRREHRHIRWFCYRRSYAESGAALSESCASVGSDRWGVSASGDTVGSPADLRVPIPALSMTLFGSRSISRSVCTVV